MNDVQDHGKPNDAWEVHALYVVYRWNDTTLEFVDSDGDWSQTEADTFTSRKRAEEFAAYYNGRVGCTSGMFMKD
jgi:hypothetical protein